MSGKKIKNFLTFLTLIKKKDGPCLVTLVKKGLLVVEQEQEC